MSRGSSEFFQFQKSVSGSVIMITDEIGSFAYPIGFSDIFEALKRQTTPSAKEKEGVSVLLMH